MKVSEEEARRLLATARKASDAARAAQEAMLSAAESRAQAVRACMEAGIPRDEIADACGVHRNLLYRITK